MKVSIKTGNEDAPRPLVVVGEDGNGIFLPMLDGRCVYVSSSGIASICSHEKFDDLLRRVQSKGRKPVYTGQSVVLEF